ncbi:hypothetical protein BO70DRAFT_117062 [Aspergillus heteromorphus CBS 117.55]|uniref:Uncharacterized protein n=1 Tax=Aspergillus heteromorphus CBS 117.55 TaxID=1448321 RepID=A0A317VHJ5_9EURO|nr:uncharacterized protein BO70DRAFT_117062 [Aspergillus heteromorphus CBS 117.55]PWY72362.1 hypothetical protein BO70DRAFT_117062 [Aspergillus heteromorphus CBS 117.55]
MAPVPQIEAEMDSHTSDMASQDSPLRRQFSEPIHARSTSTQASPSPSPVTHRSKCTWCGKYFESINGSESKNDALKEHIATVHPHIARFAMYDGADDESHADDQADEESAVAGGSEVEDDDIEAEVTENGVTVGYEKEQELNGDEPADGPDADALSNQLHEFSRDQDPVSLDQRLHNLWNIHDMKNFTDYLDRSLPLDEAWAVVLQHEAQAKEDREKAKEERAQAKEERAKKRVAAAFGKRPEPYRKSRTSKGEFLEISPLEDFLGPLRDAELRTSEELYAITENTAYALKAWQDEYLAIEKLHKLATRHTAKPVSDPRKLQRPQVFEDKKEAMLYGYKWEAKEDKVGNQNPFTQGGFKPTPAQFRKMSAKIGPNHPNPDGWRTVKKFGEEYVPKFQNPPREEFVGKATRKRKAAEMEAANKEAALSGSEVETPVVTDNEEQAARRRTRGRRPGTEGDEPPAPTRTATRGRGSGRGRGRGGSRLGASAEASHRASPSPGLGSLQARPPPAQLAPLEPAPSTIMPTASETGGSPEVEGDLAEVARRQKIANSKNPKRTEAMLNHWARFNREGRVRNPKRSKAQIEADRAAEVVRKSSELTKPPKIKKKSDGGMYEARPNPGLAPAPMPASIAPGPPAHPQLAPMAAPGPRSTHTRRLTRGR